MVDFKAPYSRASALEFLDKFLPDDFQKHDEEIKLDFKPQFIRSIKKIGEVASLENIHIYEITHESENDPRVSLSKDSFRLLANFNVRKALIFFASQNSPNYRLSFVTVDLKWESGARVKREYSNPRRYSFFLGPDARTHTPYDFLIRKGQAKDTADLLSRFDVEIVTKEFFTKYKGLFEDVSGYLEKDQGFKVFAGKNNIDIVTFSKKLLGQIVFCYFLQRKGWLGAKKGELINKGDKDFMRSLFNRCPEGKNFYNDYLEYLFYGSLNSRAEGSGDFYRKHFDCQIPFLNGGLFEPPEDYDWEKSFVHIPGKIFSNKDSTGIFDVFDLYNFTVYEDDPIDREVSVDPEMLGKVFENLLPENLRKGQGAYYTPREIVHYMCQESLINYLVTETKVNTVKISDLVVTKYFEGEGDKALIDKALQNIKVCDPACGSGAFLVGMLHEIVSARHILNLKQDEYHLKKETIQNCIYGVDIDPGAVEIAKLRLWLSLVVDYELKDIEPLPNLDYKIMCGNSLLEELIVGDETIKLFDEKLLNSPKIKKPDNKLFNIDGLEQKSGSARNEYLLKLLNEKQKQIMKLHADNQLTHEKRKVIDQEILAINKELNPKLKKSKTVDYHPTLFIEDAEKYFATLKELHEQYFTEYDPIKKKDKRRQIGQIELEFIKSSIQEKVSSIDNAIKNLNMQLEADRKHQAVLLKKKLEYLAIPEQIYSSKTRPYFLWKLNFFEVFQEKNGFDVVIANPPYVDSETMVRNEERNRNIYTSTFRSAKGNWDLFIIFIEKGLSILKREGIISYIVPNKLIAASYSEELRKLLSEKNVKELRDFSRVNVFKDVNVYPVVFRVQNSSQKDPILMVSMSSVVDVMYENRILPQIFYQDLCWDRYFTQKEVLSVILKVSKYNPLSSYGFEVTGAATVGEAYEFKKYVINKNQKNLDGYKKLINTGTIDRYLSLWGLQKTQYIKDSYSHPVVSDKDIIKVNPARYEQAKSKKIIIGGMTKELECYYDEGKYLAGKSTTIILQKEKNQFDLKLLLSLLNSKLVSFWYGNYYKSLSLAGGYLRINNAEIKTIPIPEIDLKEQKQLIDLANVALKTTETDDYATNSSKQAKVKEYESQIDKIVYKIYNLTDDEVKVVKDFN